RIWVALQSPLHMHFLRVSLIVLTFCATVVPTWAGAEELHIQRYLDEPNTRVLVVEFYAKWCQPCMDAVPHWEKLRKKYWSQGLRLVVVKTQAKEPGCPNLKWQPDDSICDLNSSIGDSLKVSALPSAFLWSWDGRLLVSDARHWKEVAAQVKRFLARNPRVEVDARNARGRADRMLRKIVEAELSGQGKFSVVAGGKLEKRIQKLRRDSHRLDRREDQKCGSDGISANSLLKVEIMGKRLAITLWNEKGCQQKGVFAPWDKKRAEASVKTALHRLMTKLVRRTPQMPGGAKLRKQFAQSAITRPAASLGGSSDWSPAITQPATSLGGSSNWSPSNTTSRDFASLSVTSLPSALTVTVDGKKIGTTPLAGHPVSAGEHTVMVFNDCFVPTGKRTFFVVGTTPKFSFAPPVR
ncbi:MAG TPA: PEGA domain-containing protein, partial [Myxococcales bacterium]|nr:PEGA domain-containing protein [Myxococcales bacterium]